jgi:hypothetical protein
MHRSCAGAEQGNFPGGLVLVILVVLDEDIRMYAAKIDVFAHIGSWWYATAAKQRLESAV